MAADNEHFLYPKVDTELCIDCGLCEHSCPVLLYRKKIKNANPQVYAAVNTNKEMYLHSASGGMFILLAKNIIYSGGIVCGATYNKEFNVQHTFAESLEECQRFQGSKYAQSNTEGIYSQIKQHLKTGRKVLFTGTPCQVAGLRGFLRKEYDNLYCADLVCHGVPSPLMLHDYLEFISEGKNIANVNFKHKTDKQPRTSIRIDFSDGTHLQNCLKTFLWDRLYFGNYAVRPSCHDCQFSHFNRAGDITIGDFWGLRKYHADFHPSQCPSLVLVNNEKGQKLFDTICNDIDFIKSSQEEARQPQLQAPTPVSIHREAFWQLYHSEGFLAVAKQYGEYTIWKRVKDFIKSSIITRQ